MKLSREIREQAIASEDAADTVVPMGKPDNIDSETWDLIQETGKLATERLYEILASPRFLRLRAGDQAKVIKIAQDRAFGVPTSNRESTKRPIIDITAKALTDLARRAALPEYKQTGKIVPDED